MGITKVNKNLIGDSSLSRRPMDRIVGPMNELGIKATSNKGYPPINLIDFIETLESELDIKAKKAFIKLQKGDVIATHADTTKIKEWINFSPKVSIEKGIYSFCKWYKNYYGYS